MTDFVAIQGKILPDLLQVSTWCKNHPEYRRGLLLPDSLSSAMIFNFAGLRSTGYRDDGRAILLQYPIQKSPGPQHATHYWFNLACSALHAWGLPKDLNLQLDPCIHLNLTETHRQEAYQSMARHDLERNKFILIAPTATGLHHGKIKTWAHYEALTQILASEDYKVVMCPPASEQTAAKLAAPSAVLIEPLALGSFAALAQQAALVVCNDSGVSHIAASVGVRQITIFGVTDPLRTRPWTLKSINLGQNGRWPSVQEVLRQTLASLTDLN